MNIRRGTKNDLENMIANNPVFEGVGTAREMAVTNEFYVMEKDGEVIFAAGVNEYWTNSGVAWALFSKGNMVPYMLSIHRAVNKFLEESCLQRIEATVVKGFEPGHRWVEMLGFEVEGYMRKYDPDGRDHLLYARIK